MRGSRLARVCAVLVLASAAVGLTPSAVSAAPASHMVVRSLGVDGMMISQDGGVTTQTAISIMSLDESGIAQVSFSQMTFVSNEDGTSSMTSVDGYGEGLGSIDARLTTGTLVADLPVSVCGPDSCDWTPSETRHIEATWTATGKATTSRLGRVSAVAGQFREVFHANTTFRPAEMQATVDGTPVVGSMVDPSGFHDTTRSSVDIYYGQSSPVYMVSADALASKAAVPASKATTPRFDSQYMMAYAQDPIYYSTTLLFTAESIGQSPSPNDRQIQAEYHASDTQRDEWGNVTSQTQIDAFASGGDFSLDAKASTGHYSGELVATICTRQDSWSFACVDGIPMQVTADLVGAGSLSKDSSHWNVTSGGPDKAAGHERASSRPAAATIVVDGQPAPAADNAYMENYFSMGQPNP